MVMLPRLRICRQMSQYSKPEVVQSTSYNTKMSLPKKLEFIPEEEETKHSCPHFTLPEVKEIC